MGKIKKAASSKHDATISPALSHFIKKASTASLAELPSHLASLSRRWPFPRGDLYHWIVTLNRFDDILETFNSKYGLSSGPQTTSFGVTQLLEGSEGTDEETLKQLGFGPEGDRELVESVLEFSRLLLEKCGNRSLYNSSDRLNELLNTTSLSLLYGTLRLALCLAQRYYARLRPNHPTQPLLANHYNLDLDRLQYLATPIAVPQPFSKKSVPTSPVKSTKGREKALQSSSGRRASNAVNPNNFRSLCKGSYTSDPHLADLDWEDWARIQITYPTPDSSEPNKDNKSANSLGQDGPSTPSPPTRHSNPLGSRLSRVSTSEESNGHPPAPSSHGNSNPTQTKKFELPPSAVLNSPLEKVLEASLPNVPLASHNELLHKLRTAYGLTASNNTRRQLLAIRLLAVANLGYVLTDSVFQQKILQQDRDAPKRQQLVYQLAELLFAGSNEEDQVPVSIQNLALSALGALTKQKSIALEVSAALGVNTNHGILLFVTQKGLADLAKDSDATDNDEGDEWRDGLFSILHAIMHATPPARSNDTFASSTLISTYVDVLKCRSGKAQRIYVKVLEFFESFTHGMKDALATLSNNKAFEASTELMSYLVSTSLELTKIGQGFPVEYRTPSIDYQVPYLHQQTIRSLLLFINGIYTHQGPHADRILRSLIDSPSLLKAFRMIIENSQAFGAHTWSEVVKAMSGFLHNEPTSYTIIAEAGLSKSFLESVTLSSIPLSPVIAVDSPTQAQSSGSAEAEANNVETMNVDSNSSRPPSSSSKTISSKPNLFREQGILPAVEAISNVSHAFGAICLTAAGKDLFRSSGALEKFFEIFESPAHAKVMDDSSLLQVLGTTFDELARHHHDLRPAILSAVLVMVARVRNLCRSKAWEIGAGSKLWSDDGDGALRVAGGNKSLLFDLSPSATDVDGQNENSNPSLELPDGNRLVMEQEMHPGRDFDTMTAEDKDEYGLGVQSYITPVIGFLVGFFESQNLCSNFIEAGGVELVLDLATSPSLPYDFFRYSVDSGPSHELAHAIHLMAETKPHLVIPSLLHRTLSGCRNLQSFADNQPNDMGCYFGALTIPNTERSYVMETEDTAYVRENGTKLTKCLASIHFLTNVLSAIFSDPTYHTRQSSQTSPFLQVNLTDMYVELCKKLGDISAACTREEIALQKQTPNLWLDATRPKDFDTGSVDVDKVFGLHSREDSTSNAGEESPTPSTFNQDSSANLGQARPNGVARSKSVDIVSAKDKMSAAFKNVQTLRYLLIQLPSSITQFYKLLAHGLIAKRRVETYNKQSAYTVGAAIANALVSQLNPQFFKSSETYKTKRQFTENRFAYLVVVLFNLYQVILDTTPSADHKQCITIVFLAFKKNEGLRVLKNIGEEFFNELKSCEVSDDTIQSMTDANSGLKVTLDILDQLTSAKCVVDSTQSGAMKSMDRTKPHYFVPAQFLLELRMEALPLALMIWDSSYADQASKAVVETLISILKHVLSGEQELEAFKASDSLPPLTFNSPKKLIPNTEKVNALKAANFKEDLAREALFRCHNNSTTAEEYCKAYSRNPGMVRNPIPSYEISSAASEDHGSARETPPLSSSRPEASDILAAVISDNSAGLSLADMLTFNPDVALDSEMQGTEPPASAPLVPTSSSPSAGIENDSTNVGNGLAMSIDNLLNQSSTADNPAHTSAPKPLQTTPVQVGIHNSAFTVESMNSQREVIRKDLADSCLNVLNSHYNVTFELSELIMSATKKLNEEEAADFRENVARLVVNSLVSLQTNETSQGEGKRIAAYAHLTALLIQDKDMYQLCLEPLKESFQDLLGFIRIAPSQDPSSEESSPWIGQVLLIIEKMLSDDAEPVQIKWTQPSSLDDPIPQAKSEEKEILLPNDKTKLFRAVVDILPRVGKDKSLALSATRILAILTRSREIATDLAERRNLQRLFVMIKQLASGADDRLQSALMIILRHIIEDEETLRQIMRSEIAANFDSRSTRQTDTTGYVRQMYHLVLRSPEIFIEVTNEKLKLQRYDIHLRTQNLVLKSDYSATKSSGPPSAPVDGATLAQAGDQSSEPRHSVEQVTAEDTSRDPNTKSAEIKAPIVEHPDGVIHFLLSEILSYKDVDDKETAPALGDKATSSTTVSETETEMANSSASGTARNSDAATPTTSGKTEKVPFKGEDHPIYIYRCFLLQCLTELLHSYNRTKVEFINFSRKADPLAMTPSKPRSGVLNYLLNGLIPVGEIEDSTSFKKRATTSDWAMKMIVALCSKTGELGLIPSSQRYSTYQRIADNDDEPDLTFVRRFVLEHALKAFKDASVSTEPLQTKYTRMQCLADLFNRLLSKPSGSDGSAGSNNTSYKTLGKMMFEKNFITILTTSLADIDLSFPGSKRVVKYILRPLKELSDTAIDLSLNSSTVITSALGQTEEGDISSASSVSEMDDEREETPDLFRNSTLGMLEPNRQHESSSESEDGEDDEMYEDEYADEMEYEEGMPTLGPHDGEVVSDEDIEDELGGPGPIEGLPGDVPMDIELVMGDPHMDIDSDDEDDEAEDEEEDEDDVDDDDDDGDDDDPDDGEDGEDFLVDADDAIMEGEINGDDENDSIADGEGGEEEWQSDDEEDDEEAEDMEGDFQEELEGIMNTTNPNGNDAVVDADGSQGLNNLLRIVGGNQGNGDGRAEGDIADILGQVGMGVRLEDHEDDDDGEGDEFDENEEDLTYQTFNEMLNNPDPGSPWPWDDGEQPGFLRGHNHHNHHHSHHHHFRAAPGHLPSFMSRHFTNHGMPMPTTIHRSHRATAPIRATDDGVNPLLQRGGGASSSASGANPSTNDYGQSSSPGFMSYLTTTSGHGGMLDAIMEAVQRGEGRVEVGRHGRLDIRVDAPPQRFRELMRPSFSHTIPRSLREDPHRAVAFTASMTVTRWQEEARLLFGSSYIEKTQRVVMALLSVLVPPAIEEEKARLAALEEERKREEREKAEQERQDKIAKEEAEKKQKEEEEREAAAKLAAEEAAAAAEAEAAAQTQRQTDADDVTPGGPEPMQDVRSTDANSHVVAPTADTETAGVEENSSHPTPRVYTTIRGRQLDITGMSIDPEFLEGIPEEFREEVIMQQYAEQRHQAEEHGQPATDINRDFLEALPEDIREELLQQEAQDRRRRERDAARRRAAEAGGPARAEEMDPDSFFATLPDALRRSILAEQSDEVLRNLGPEYAAEARALISRQLHQYGRIPVARETRDEEHVQEQTSHKEAKRQVVQMVDKAGVATLLRLMFMPQQGSARNSLLNVLHNVCNHRQTRAEVISLLLLILKDGSADISAVERSLAHLSLRAKTTSQKTPQPVKRTLSLPTSAGANGEMTPLMVVQQCLGALGSLTQGNAHIASVFLRELDSASAYKSKSNRKGKAKETRASKYALNDLISLLDRNIITENSSCMESLSSLLSMITQPLTWLLKKDKDKDKLEDASDAKSGQPSVTEDTTGSNTHTENPLAPEPAVEVAEVETASPDATRTDAVSLASPVLVAPSHGSLPSTEPNTGSVTTNGDATSSIAEPKADIATTIDQETKLKKWFSPPDVPDHNLRLVVSILAARECNGKTFRETLSTINNLSLIPGARDVFGKELVDQAQVLSQAISTDLDELLPKIRDAKSGTDIQGIAATKFSPASSDQAKLLRVLTALDYLFDPKRPENKDKLEDEATNANGILTSLYESPTFGPLWSKLSECLSAIREKDNMLSVATILLPLIESLMIVCKNTSLKDAHQTRQVRELSVTSPGSEYTVGLEHLFFNFTTEHRKILNELVRQNSKLMSGSFSLLVKNPKVLEFDNKRAYFTRQVHSRIRETRVPQPPLQLSVRRDQVFLDSFKSLYFKSPEEMKYGKLSIRFHGEEGVDAGGVTREWFQVLARGMFNPNYALFIPVASDRTTFHPNRLSGVNSEHLMFFKFIGRIIGKALYENRVLDCHFSRAVYKCILGKAVSLKDMETLDLDYYKSLVWMLENDITDLMISAFSIESEDFGEPRTIDLIENGRNIPVTEDNKHDYVQRVVEYRLTGSVQDQLENFLKGFHDIIPAELISIFNEQELELLISGLPEINIEDWKANTEYHNYSASSQQIQWFWRAVRSFSGEEKAKLLQFVTGTSKVPLNGFKELEGMNGFTKFNIHKDYGNKDRLPSSHTCFNQLDLPEYESYEKLKQRLTTACNMGSEYFGFA